MYYALMLSAPRPRRPAVRLRPVENRHQPYNFKRGFGFEPVPLHNEFMLLKRETLPEVNPKNRKYGLFISAWRRLPLWLANFAGPYLSRDLE